jgi:hypothetical protein
MATVATEAAAVAWAAGSASVALPPRVTTRRRRRAEQLEAALRAELEHEALEERTLHYRALAAALAAALAPGRHEHLVRDGDIAAAAGHRIDMLAGLPLPADGAADGAAGAARPLGRDAAASHVVQSQRPSPERRRVDTVPPGAAHHGDDAADDGKWDAGAYGGRPGDTAVATDDASPTLQPFRDTLYTPPPGSAATRLAAVSATTGSRAAQQALRSWHHAGHPSPSQSPPRRHVDDVSGTAGAHDEQSHGAALLSAALGQRRTAQLRAAANGDRSRGSSGWQDVSGAEAASLFGIGAEYAQPQHPRLTDDAQHSTQHDASFAPHSVDASQQQPTFRSASRSSTARHSEHLVSPSLTDRDTAAGAMLDANAPAARPRGDSFGRSSQHLVIGQRLAAHSHHGSAAVTANSTLLTVSSIDLHEGNGQRPHDSHRGAHGYAHHQLPLTEAPSSFVTATARDASHFDASAVSAAPLHASLSLSVQYAPSMTSGGSVFFPALGAHVTPTLCVTPVAPAASTTTTSWLSSTRHGGGFHRNDTIRSINGIAVASIDALLQWAAEATVSTAYSFAVVRHRGGDVHRAVVSVGRPNYDGPDPHYI